MTRTSGTNIYTWVVVVNLLTPFNRIPIKLVVADGKTDEKKKKTIIQTDIRMWFITMDVYVNIRNRKLEIDIPRLTIVKEHLMRANTGMT